MPRAVSCSRHWRSSSPESCSRRSSGSPGRLLGYEELGSHLVRLGLSWLFLTFLSFLAFSAIVTSLASFFLSEDLRYLLAAPLQPARFFYARLCKAACRHPGWSSHS